MPAGRDPRVIAADFKIIEAMSPELRALVYEYGLKCVQTGRARRNTDDPEKVKAYCMAERAARQRQLEAIAQSYDNTGISYGLLGGLGPVRVRAG
jgi:hypothetical protein